MKKMKTTKILSLLLLGALLILSLAACGSTHTEGNSPSDGTSAPARINRIHHRSRYLRSVRCDRSGGKKVLVVNFSASGSTARIAERIADAAHADLFEIVPENVYTSADLNWSDENSRVGREHEDESLRDVPLKTAAVDNWEDYDTVLIGYPIWWGIAAWPVNGFVQTNDFTGKTVIPFCTSASSGLGQSGKLLADTAKGGNWQEGQRFASNASDSTVTDWVDGLGLGK